MLFRPLSDSRMEGRYGVEGTESSIGCVKALRGRRSETAAAGSIGCVRGTARRACEATKVLKPYNKSAFNKCTVSKSTAKKAFKSVNVTSIARTPKASPRYAKPMLGASCDSCEACEVFESFDEDAVNVVVVADVTGIGAARLACDADIREHRTCKGSVREVERAEMTRTMVGIAPSTVRPN